MLREELSIIKNREYAIEQFLAVYENGVVASKPVKTRVKIKSGQSAHSRLVDLAKKIAGENNGIIAGGRVVDAAMMADILPGLHRSKYTRRINNALAIETTRGTFKKMFKGRYKLKNV